MLLGARRVSEGRVKVTWALPNRRRLERSSTLRVSEGRVKATWTLPSGSRLERSSRRKIG
jgi:hypothetical protein